MNTNLEGRVRNTTLTLSQNLMPLFEAVVNSIHATEDFEDIEDRGKIVVSIIREPEQPEFEEIRRNARFTIPKISDFIIQDCGSGFDTPNFEAFKTLDTSHKANKGCKGMGRLLWLKAFEKVEIESTFIENGEWKHRSFEFSLPDGVCHEQLITLAGEENHRKTVVKLEGFKSEYQNKAPKNASTIAQDVLNHCMWYFLREGQMPDIEVKDESEKHSLIKLYEENIDRQAKHDEITINGHNFGLLHVKIRSDIKECAYVSFCANNRIVTNEKLSFYDKLFSHKLKDDEGLYSYQCYIMSPILDKCVVADRSEFNFDLDSELLGGNSITKQDIICKVNQCIKEYLSKDITALKEETERRVQAFVEKSSPRYRSIVNYLQPGDLTPSSTDKEIELKLHEKLYDVETSILKEGHKLLQAPADTDDKSFKESINDFIRKIITIKSSDLASYVFYRKFVLNVLQQAIQKGKDNKYPKEDIIHNLIFPMRHTSDECELLNENLWIIDERLVFHHFLASDKSITSLPITTAKDRKEPDIILMRTNRGLNPMDSLSDNPILVAEASNHRPMASLTIVEFKRPMRNDRENPFYQVYNYFEKIKSGVVTTKDGRPIANHDKLPGYAYIIADLSNNLKTYCIREDLKETYDGMGYFGYKSNLGLYVEVISYDKLLQAAKERNQAFFDKLGITSI